MSITSTISRLYRGFLFLIYSYLPTATSSLSTIGGSTVTSGMAKKKITNFFPLICLCIGTFRRSWNFTEDFSKIWRFIVLWDIYSRRKFQFRDSGRINTFSALCHRGKYSHFSVISTRKEIQNNFRMQHLNGRKIQWHKVRVRVCIKYEYFSMNAVKEKSVKNFNN